jgi:hypothetical protein
MTRAQPRTHFHSSRLTRFLADLSLLDAIEPGNAFAEKLGLWVDFTDAIALSSVHSNATALTRLPSATGLADNYNTMSGQIAAARTRLENAIAQGGSNGAGRTRIALPAPTLELPLDVTTAYAPYRRYYLAHQRDMELAIAPLRSNARDVLASAAPALQKLAALDAALEAILNARESKLLAKLPLLFKKRFVQLFKAHQQTLVDAQCTDNPAQWMQPGGWQARFCNELQTVLLAELDMRLQPTMGLMEALYTTTRQPS